jgi:hypothetical protein
LEHPLPKNNKDVPRNNTDVSKNNEDQGKDNAEEEEKSGEEEEKSGDDEEELQEKQAKKAKKNARPAKKKDQEPVVESESDDPELTQNPNPPIVDTPIAPTFTKPGLNVFGSPAPDPDAPPRTPAPLPTHPSGKSDMWEVSKIVHASTPLGKNNTPKGTGALSNKSGSRKRKT